ncbi:ankyrin repeat and SOCS box protein 12-like [Argonauta hians]
MNPIQMLLHPVFDSLGDVEDSDLHKAARQGDLDQMKSILSAPSHTTKLDTNVKNSKGQTPLAQAAAGGHNECVKLLLEHNCETNISDIKAQTPLFVALRNQHLDVAQSLLIHGADPDGDEANTSTPLSHAAWHGHIEAIKLLLEFGADVNLKNQTNNTLIEFQTPLSLAFAYQHLECIKLLLKSGADPNLCRNFCHKAVQKKYPSIYIQLFYEFGINLFQTDKSQKFAWELDDEGNECVRLLKIIKSTPRPLKSSCRICIWKYIGWERIKKINELAMLPKILILYLNYDDICS